MIRNSRSENMPQYFPWPYSVDPLPEDLRRGLWPVGIFALMSTVATLALLCWITYRLVSWRKHYRSYVGYNQYVLLIYNLLLADLQQSISFLISFHWIHTDSMLAPSPACFGQAWLVQIGDISSGMFVLAIALHTFFSVVKGRQLPFRAFLIGTIVIWALALLLTVLGPAMHGSDYFTAAGAWVSDSFLLRGDRRTKSKEQPEEVSRSPRMILELSWQAGAGKTFISHGSTDNDCITRKRLTFIAS